MKIAVVSEVSARHRNGDLISALDGFGFNIANIGMTEGEYATELTYIHTGFMAGALLNAGVADMVIGGCGTGQGFLNSAMQYPNVFCGLILEPLDAFLFSRINAGNCVSLALNKGYGWAGELNLRYMFEKLFSDASGGGYPPERRESQRRSRIVLQEISKAAHKSFDEILKCLDKEIIQTVLSHEPFCEYLAKGNRAFLDRLLEAGR
ncbi:MAG TPA: RpiB/LacA/LacB family sugar-phosphate isomerase [Bacillota bacterium]|jgi:ribose 5-phosphate isomerase RpiB|nr:ribose-5-phosphate isomerase [Bacillota bacterium]HOA35825.1 RpiB/LacA/LacB family sugar-phosphate isomerase [Bacillota bacterium]HOJ83893.1 RpiB/LacA/LacB family sugar-phosphate isomerase [Bacillota bacterium]HPZ11982.1 RpiB/LacA/LacB family sugar-phosphate isomerase [Bacillota bacterium]HQE10098.1 RpiB/LacA/LacB family sugar-phosphate isomerase [Bacillota bacterium]